MLQLWNACALLLAMHLARLTGIHSPLLTVRLRNASTAALCSNLIKQLAQHLQNMQAVHWSNM